MILDRAVAAVVPCLPRRMVGLVARRYISGETLESALAKFGPQGLEALPVVDQAREGRLVGILRRDSVTAFYNRRLFERLND